MQIELTFGQFFFGILFGVLILLGAFFLIKSFVLKFKKPELIGYSIKQIQSRWSEIEKLIEQKTEMSFKLAIIEADKLLDHVLKALGFPGDDMGQRLKAACYKHENLRKVWFAHKVRNQLVHESSFNLTYWQARDAIRSFRDALRELNVL